jgi:hypothetical protein
MSLQPALSAYLDGELDPGDSGRLIHHLEACPECSATLAAYRQLGAGLRALPTPTLPRNMAIRLRVDASHRAASGQHWIYWKMRLRSAIEALAVPMTVGTTAALCLFIALAGGVRGSIVDSNLPDVLISSATPPRLTSLPDANIGGNVMVEAQIDASGHVYGYNVLSGPADAGLISRLNNQLLLGVFQPATTTLGQPTIGSVVVSFGTVDVRG